MIDAKIINSLNNLLTRCYDAEKGYKDAAEQVRLDNYRDIFLQYSQQRYRFGKQLKEEIKRLGGTPDKGTSVKGDIHRMWMDLRAALVHHNEVEIMSEIERGEKAMIDTYNEALEEAKFPPETRGMIEDQLAAVEASLKRIKALNSVYA